MNCGRISRLISAYLDGELSGMEMFAVREHVHSCQSCSAELEGTRQMKAIMGRLRPVKPSTGLEASLLAALGAETVPANIRFQNWLHSHFSYRLQPAATAVAVCAALLVVAMGRVPRSVDDTAAMFPSAFSLAPAGLSTTAYTVAPASTIRPFPVSDRAMGLAWRPAPLRWGSDSGTRNLSTPTVSLVTDTSLVGN